MLLFCWFFQGEKISTILKAANVEVEPYWPGLFAKALEGINVKDLITNIGSGVGAAPAGGAAPAAAAAAAPAAAAVEKKVEKEESEASDDDMGFGNFHSICFSWIKCERETNLSLFLLLQVFSNKNVQNRVFYFKLFYMYNVLVQWNMRKEIKNFYIQDKKM